MCNQSPTAAATRSTAMEEQRSGSSQWLRTAMKLEPGHFCPVYDSSTSNLCTRALCWKLRHPLSGTAASGFPAQFSLQPLLKWVTNLHGGLKAFWASLGSHSPFTGIALNKYVVILTPSWSLLPGCLPHAPWIDTLLPTTADLLFSVEIRFALSMITVYIHLCMASFTQHDNLGTYQFCWSCQELIAFLLLSSILSKLLTSNWVVTSWSY